MTYNSLDGEVIDLLASICSEELPIFPTDLRSNWSRFFICKYDNLCGGS